ncbi:MAG: hypothetical protein V1494_03015 [Candidatus Diapherotrites archaeon]
MAEEGLMAFFSGLWHAVLPYVEIVYPNFASMLPMVVTLMFSIAAYGFLVFNFYRFVAKRDVFETGLAKYHNKTSLSPSIMKFIVRLFEYGMIFPFIVFLWFGGFSVLLFLMAKNIDTTQILLISVTFVASIRLVSYYSDDLAKDMAKLIPFAFLGVAIVEPSFFSLDLLGQRLGEIPKFIPQIAAYLLFMVLLEWALRVLLFFKQMLFGISAKDVEKAEQAEKESA